MSYGGVGLFLKAPLGTQETLCHPHIAAYTRAAMSQLL